MSTTTQDTEAIVADVRRRLTAPAIGDRVTVKLVNREGDLTGRTDSGTVHDVNPFGVPTVLFDDGTLHNVERALVVTA